MNSSRNVFRFSGDLSHLLALFFLLYKMIKNRSCGDISGKTQLLLLTVFATRYLDLFFSYVSAYNSLMKITFIACTLTSVFIIYVALRRTHLAHFDTHYSELLVFGSVILALNFNYGTLTASCDLDEILWAFSIYLEAVAILPQLHLLIRKDEIELSTAYYLYLLSMYRSMYILNWGYRYVVDGHFDVISIAAGCVQTLVFVVFFAYVWIRRVPMIASAMDADETDADVAVKKGFLSNIEINLHPNDLNPKLLLCPKELENEVKLAEAEAGVV